MHIYDPPFIRLPVLERIEPLAPNRGTAFLVAYKLASGEYSMLGRDPQTNMLWTEVRRNFINRHEQQAKKLREPYWNKEGTPTPRHLALLMWAYTPTPERTQEWLRRGMKPAWPSRSTPTASSPRSGSPAQVSRSSASRTTATKKSAPASKPRAKK